MHITRFWANRQVVENEVNDIGGFGSKVLGLGCRPGWH